MKEKYNNVQAMGEVFTSPHLADDAKACIEIVKRSMPPKLYREIDSFQMAAFATAWAIHKRCVEEINKPDFEFVITRDNGMQTQSSWLVILTTQANALATLGDRLGLDPRSRQGLHLPEQLPPKSKFEGLVGAVQSEPSESSASLRS